MIHTESDFLQFAIRHYDNNRMESLSDFEQDLKRFRYVNNLLSRYMQDNTDLQERLILNHIIILSNCFSVSGAIQMFQFKTYEQNKIALNTFLYFLNYIEKSEIGLDFSLLHKLESI